MVLINGRKRKCRKNFCEIFNDGFHLRRKHHHRLHSISGKYLSRPAHLVGLVDQVVQAAHLRQAVHLVLVGLSVLADQERHHFLVARVVQVVLVVQHHLKCFKFLLYEYKFSFLLWIMKL